MTTYKGEMRFCPGCPMAGGCEGDITGSKVLVRKNSSKKETLVSLTDGSGHESSAFRVNTSSMLGRLAVGSAVAECRGPVNDYTIRVPAFAWPTFRRRPVSSETTVCAAAERLRNYR